MKKNILITGSGVLSAYVAKEFLKKGCNVIITSRHKKKNYKNFNFLRIEKKVIFVKLDLLNKKQIKKLIVKYSPESIFYFSGQSSLVKSLKLKESTHKSNFLGAKIFLQVLKERNLQTKFYKANSGYIFNPRNGLITLQSKFMKSNNPYINSQIKAFKIVKKFRSEGLNCFSIVFLQVESPLRKKSFFIKKVCCSAKFGKFIKVGNIHTIRDYSWAPEVASGIYYLSKTNIKDIILSSGKGISGQKILEIAYNRKKLNYKKFYKINPNFVRKNEAPILIGYDKKMKILYQKFKWKPKIYGKKIVNLMYSSI